METGWMMLGDLVIRTFKRPARTPESLLPRCLGPDFPAVGPGLAHDEQRLPAQHGVEKLGAGTEQVSPEALGISWAIPAPGWVTQQFVTGGRA